MNIGIDYSLGRKNFDPETKIHFGVISQHEVLEAWAEGSEPYYVYHCPHCGEEFEKTCTGEDGKECTESITNIDDVPKTCPKCSEEIDSENDFDEMEASSYYIETDEYSAECGDDGDIFIGKSPYYTHCRYCSPCAPGAGDIMSPVKGGVKTYCFGHEWFDSGKAPYPVYLVKTGERVRPEKDKPTV
jgi:hypothetical protein